jgi:hypothetical protein
MVCRDIRERSPAVLAPRQWIVEILLSHLDTKRYSPDREHWAHTSTVAKNTSNATRLDVKTAGFLACSDDSIRD